MKLKAMIEALEAAVAAAVDGHVFLPTAVAAEAMRRMDRRSEVRLKERERMRADRIACKLTLPSRRKYSTPEERVAAKRASDARYGAKLRAAKAAEPPKPTARRYETDAERLAANRECKRRYEAKKREQRRLAKQAVRKEAKAPKPKPARVQPVVQRTTERAKAQRTLVTPAVRETFPDSAAWIAANQDKVERIPAAWERRA